MDLSYYLSTIGTSLFIVSIALCIVSLLAFAIHYYTLHKKQTALIESLILLPLFLPPVAIGLLVLELFGKQGLLGSFLYSIFQQSIVFRIEGAILIAIIITLPIVYQQIKVGYLQLDPHMMLAAKSEGASNVQVYRYIILPSLKDALASSYLLSIARILGEYGATTIVAGNIIGKTHTLSMGLYTAIEQGSRVQMFVIFVLLFGIACILLVLYRSVSTQKGT